MLAIYRFKMSGNDEEIGKLVFKRAGKVFEVDPESLRAPRLYKPYPRERASKNVPTTPLVQNDGHRPSVDVPKPLKHEVSNSEDKAEQDNDEKSSKE